MHDVDRTLLEFEGEYGETAAQEVMSGEGEDFLGIFETEAQEQGFLGEANEAQEQGFLGETYEAQEAQEQEFLGEIGQEAVFDEVTEMELAAELLELSNEDELEQFLGKLIKKAANVVGSVAKGPLKALLPVLKKAAKVALPVAGAALGNLVVPGLGGAIGGKLASAAGSMFGLELEGLSSQDREFEVARRYVRFAGAAANRMARTPTRVPIRNAVRSAAIGAARRHIPGLVRPRTVAAVSSAIRQARQGGRRYPVGGRQPIYGDAVYAPSYVNGGAPSSAGADGYPDDGGGAPGFSRTGRWYRRGRKIVLMGV